MASDFERLNKTAHSFIINDDKVKEYLENCRIPANVEDVTLDRSLLHKVDYNNDKNIDFVITVDGTIDTIPVRKKFPSSLISFFQFGTLLIKRSDLEMMKQKPFVSPTDIKKLKEIEREKLVLPIQNISLKTEEDLKTAARNAIHQFFFEEHTSDDTLISTLYWFIFEEYSNAPKQSYNLSKCPNCGTKDIFLNKSSMNKSTYSWGDACTDSNCVDEILLTDVFRLFEKIDNETGASGIISYLRNLIESFLMVHNIRAILSLKRGFINRFLFVKNGPLSFGGETANMHKPMKNFINYLRKEYSINIVGVEKEGAFVDHAKEIKSLIDSGQLFLLNNKHIYSYILNGNPKTSKYASTSYYSGKMIYRSPDDKLYVLTMPVKNHNLYYDRPEISDLPNISEILEVIDFLKCDIYENSLIPLAIVNKLISLSNLRSSKILEKFAKQNIGT